MIQMTFVQFAIIVLWIWGSRFIYSKLYRARKLLVIHGDRDPGDLIHKMNSRSDKYNISGMVHVNVGEKEIHKMMRDYEGVIIWDPVSYTHLECRPPEERTGLQEAHISVDCLRILQNFTETGNMEMIRQ